MLLICGWSGKSKTALLLAAALLAAAPASTQAATSTASTETPGTNAQQEERLQALRAVQKSLDTKAELLETVEVGSEDEAGEPGEQVQLLRGEVDALRDQFESLATGAETDLWRDQRAAPFDLRSELEMVFRPMIEELQRTTTGSREIERLRTQVDLNQQRIESGRGAVVRLNEALEAITPADDLSDDLSEEQPGDDLLESLTALRELYASRVVDAEAQQLALAEQLEERQGDRPSLTSAARRGLSGFVRYRGLNLVLALAAFLAVFLLIRLAGQFYERLRGETRRRTLAERLITIVLHIASVVLGLLAALVVLNARADWFLLGLFLILLASLAWGGIKALPTFVEQIRLMLNLGAVREGEVLQFEGLPWQVETIGLRAMLRNPRLGGGNLHLPVGELIGLHSRGAGDGEAMFPSQEDDWVELDDGVIGQVVLQTPRTVKVELLGGAQKAYGTTSFLGLNPKNLSGGFRVEHVFGLDYGHQAISTTEIPQAMERALSEELLSLLSKPEIQRVEVEFREANASSLDYEIQVDLAGSAARRYEDVERAIPRILVDLCNKEGWTIPFPQLTVHGPSAAAP